MLISSSSSFAVHVAKRQVLVTVTGYLTLGNSVHDNIGLGLGELHLVGVIDLLDLLERLAGLDNTLE
jgi:hypothetical protein